MVTSPLPGRPGSIAGREEIFSSPPLHPDLPVAQPFSYPMATGGSFARIKAVDA